MSRDWFRDARVSFGDKLLRRDSSEMKRVAVIGAGSWGTALGIMAARRGHDVRLWSRNADVVDSVNREHLNPVYLPDSQIPERVLATGKIEEAELAEFVILAALHMRPELF